MKTILIRAKIKERKSTIVEIGCKYTKDFNTCQVFCKKKVKKFFLHFLLIFFCVYLRK